MTTCPVSVAALAVAGVLVAGCGGGNSVSDAVPSAEASSEVSAEESAGSAEGDEGSGGESEESTEEGSKQSTEEGNPDESSGDGSGEVAKTPDGWVVVTDQPSGIAVAMPRKVEPKEQQGESGSGEMMDTRSYFVVEDQLEVGFNVLDLSGGMYDLQAGVDGTAQALSATVKSTDEITVDGYDAIQAELSFGSNYISVMQLIIVGDFVLQPMVSTAESNRETAEKYFGQLTESLDLE